MDLETYGKDNEVIPYCVCILLKKEKICVYRENKNESLLDKVIKEFKKRKTYETFYVHNLTFDGMVIIKDISKGKDVEFKVMVFKGNIYELEIWSSDFRIKIKCSYKLMPISLKKIGLLLKENLEKLEFPHEFVSEVNYNNYVGKHPLYEDLENWDLRKECIRYCFRDCEIVKAMLKKIFYNDKVRRSSEARSISGLALSVFKKEFNEERIETRLKIKDDREIRKAYFGGRCEVFGNKKEKEKVFHFDFTGMYSSVMKEDFCYGQIKTIKNPESVEIEKEGFYEVTVVSKDMDIPVLPIKNEEGRLIFPNGKWRGSYWYEELLLFKEEGGVIEKVHKIITFNKKGKPFISFVNYFNELRKESDFDNVFWKLFINSVYGRMGMGENIEKTEIVDYKNYENFKEKDVIKEVLLNGLLIISYIEKEEKEFINSNVAIAAAITSKARIKLYKGYKSVIKEGGRILYSDTDSIFAAFERDVSNEKHGEVFWDTRKKNTVIKDAIFAIPKGYAIKLEKNEKIRIKGFAKNSISYKEFEEAFWDKEEILKNEKQLYKSNFNFKFERIEKTIILHNYSKRIFNKNKTETKPINFFN